MFREKRESDVDGSAYDDTTTIRMDDSPQWPQRRKRAPTLTLTLLIRDADRDGKTARNRACQQQGKGRRVIAKKRDVPRGR